MAVAHQATVESHTGTTGSASEAFFDLSVSFSATTKGLLVYTFVNANADDATSVKIDPAGANIDVPAFSGGRAVDTAGEAGDCKAWFLGSGLPTSVTTVRINRTNNADVMYAQCITQTALTDTEVTGVVLEQEDQALTEENIDDGSPGTDSVRYLGLNSGRAQLADIPAGANSTQLLGIDFGARLATTFRENTAGQGSRPVGANTSGNVDDVAAVYLAVREVSAGGAATVTPAVISVTASLPTPAVLAASIVTPAVVATVASLPTPTILAASLVAPATIAVVTTLPTPTIVVDGGPAVVTPATISVLAALPTPLILAAARVTPAGIVVSVTLPTPVAAAGALVLPGVIALSVTLPTPTLLAASTVNPATITVLVGLPTPLILIPGLVTPATIGLIVALPTPLAIVAVPTFWQPAPVGYTLNPVAYVPVRAGDDPPW